MSDRLVWQRGRESEHAKPTASSSTSSSADKSSVGFLYKQQELDREAYLTGKKVDKNFTAYLEKEKDNFDASLNPHKNDAEGEFDMGRKIKEDPFALVKEKEHEQFKKLQANPQKMARMKKLMMAYLGNESDDSSDDDSSRKKKSSSRRRSRSRSRSRDRKRDKRRRSREKKKKESPKRSRSRSKSPMKPGYGLINVKGKVADKRKDDKYVSEFAKYKRENEGYSRKEKHGFTTKMSAEEKAKRLAEMSGNADWREETRKNRVKKGREIDEAEEKANNTNDHSYYRKIKMAATEQSLEDRVKARGSANQKTNSALEKNWTKRS